MKILFALTYYRPHVSGLTIYVQRLAETLAARGHTITVLTSQYEKNLPSEETINGVRVVRVPVWFRVSKGTIMPSYMLYALPELRNHDVVAMNLPNTPFEAFFLPFLARFVVRRPITATYHCDVQLPRGVWNRVVDQFVFAANMAAGLMVDRFIAYTDDYANHSHILSRFPHKRVIIPPPVIISEPTTEEIAAFRAEHAPDNETLIGFAARFATEKGVEYILEALPIIREAVPNARVLFAGEYQKVIGEDEYRARLQPLLDQAGENWQFLGVLDPDQIRAFYGACAVTILPSINSTESFGLVQVESMLCGTPVVASNLPGVRVPVQATGMGKIVPIQDSPVLADAIIDVLKSEDRYIQPRDVIESHFSIETTVAGYITTFNDLSKQIHGKSLLNTSEVGGGPGSLTHDPGSVDYLAQHLREEPQFRALLRTVESKLWEEVGELEEPVLDLGCGDGQYAGVTFTRRLLAGVDPFAFSVKQARDRDVYDLSVIGSAMESPFASDLFGSVVSNSSVEHIPDAHRTLSEAARVLKPGGRFVFCSPSHRFAEMLFFPSLFRRIGLKGLAKRYEGWFNNHSDHFHTYSHETWHDLLDQHGFELESYQYYFSSRAHRTFDVLHYLGVPRLITHKLTGRWVLFPAFSLNTLFRAWLRPMTENYKADGPNGEGPYLFLYARKRA